MRSARATLDEQIVSKWAIRRANHETYTLLAGAVIVILAVALVAAGASDKAIGAVILLGIVLNAVSNIALRCPNCSRIPGSVFWGVRSRGVDFCKHCHYWLVHPSDKDGPHMT